MLSVKPSERRRIALVDCNNFYASCERVFRLDWQQRPLGVLSNNDGCLVARSNELKDANIPMGSPLFKVRAQLQALNAVVVSSNYELYGDMSARVMETLSQFTPNLEIYSIDEAWLDLSGFNPAILEGYAREIAATTKRNTGIPVSIGIAPTKVLAKIANRICKKRKIPGQVFNLGNENALDDVLSSIAVGDICGIGRRLAPRLNQAGIFTALDLRNCDPDRMRQQYSVVMQRLILELRGIPSLGAEEVAPKKQIIASRSFRERVTDLNALQEAVSYHVTRAGEKLRHQGSVCGMLQVSLRTGRHNPNERYFGRSTQVQFATPTADTRKLIRAARQAAEQIYLEGPRYAKAGIMLFDLTPANRLQLGLFELGDSDRSRALMEVVDQLNRCYGKKTVFFASEGIQKRWVMKRQMRTPAYTTCWEDLPEVR